MPRFVQRRPHQWGRASSGSVLLAGVLPLSLTACSGTYETGVNRDLDAASSQLVFPESRTTGAHAPSTDDPVALGSEASYLALVLRDNPQVRAAFERWKASRDRISTTRRLPEPTVSFAYFVRSVETRVGPQRAKLSLQQSFPWPAQYGARADAASAQARAAQRRFEARVLSLREGVSHAYWDLWFVRRAVEIHREHLIIVRGLSETLLGRLSTGTASLADQQQVDLRAARLEDAIASFEDAEFRAAAALRARCSLEPGTKTPTTDPGAVPQVPTASLEQLAAALDAHPMIEVFNFVSEAAQHRARSERSKRLPGFSVRADWIMTGDAVMPGTDQSGQDAVAIGAGVRIPLWQRSYAGAVDAARAEGRASLAEREAAIDAARSRLESQASRVRETGRRIDVYEHTLIPQAAAAYDSLLGSFAVGKATLAQTLLAQREWLELRIELERARSQHAKAWASLEFVHGHPIAGKPAKAQELMDPPEPSRPAQTSPAAPAGDPEDG